MKEAAQLRRPVGSERSVYGGGGIISPVQPQKLFFDLKIPDTDRCERDSNTAEQNVLLSHD